MNIKEVELTCYAGATDEGILYILKAEEMDARFGNEDTLRICLIVPFASSKRGMRAYMVDASSRPFMGSDIELNTDEEKVVFDYAYKRLVQHSISFKRLYAGLMVEYNGKVEELDKHKASQPGLTGKDLTAEQFESWEEWLEEYNSIKAEVDVLFNELDRLRTGVKSD